MQSYLSITLLFQHRSLIHSRLLFFPFVLVRMTVVFFFSFFLYSSLVVFFFCSLLLPNSLPLFRVFDLPPPTRSIHTKGAGYKWLWYTSMTISFRWVIRLWLRFFTTRFYSNSSKFINYVFLSSFRRSEFGVDFELRKFLVGTNVLKEWISSWRRTRWDGPREWDSWWTLVVPGGRSVRDQSASVHSPVHPFAL